MKKYFLAITALICVQSINAMIVHDPVTCLQVLNNGLTAVNQLNVTKKELSTVTSTLDLAQQNSQSLQTENWNDISQLISELNSVASVPQSMSWATANSVETFSQLFPGVSTTSNYLTDLTARSTGAISTFRANLATVQGLGQALDSYKNTLQRIVQAQSGVQGHLSASEQSNQIQGNILNEQEKENMLLMAQESNTSAFYAYQVQQKQAEIDAVKLFVNNSTSQSADYNSGGQGLIPTL